VTIAPDLQRGGFTIRHPELVRFKEDDAPVLGAHGEVLVLRDNPLPASIDCMPTANVSFSADDLAQTWEWPGGRKAAEAVLSRCSHALILTEFVATMLRVPTRIDVFVDTLAARTRCERRARGRRRDGSCRGTKSDGIALIADR
jgi:hypothetical protein